MVRLANEEPDLHEAGAEIVALVVDPPGRNEALRQRWRLPFPVVSDPGGERFLQPLDMWNPDEHDGIAWPTLAVFDPDGAEIYRMRSRDFADRPNDTDLLDAVRSLTLPPISLDPAGPTAEPVEDRVAFRPDAFGAFFRGMRSGLTGLARRLTNEEDRVEAQALADMASSFLDAWRDRRA
ncbi:MAG: redoxin domain-containing protein [Acidobacteria bacterium]|nr:redoxin domain-containing protein [Acidobacteriota bacterium]